MTMELPRIAVTAYWRAASWSHWVDYPACLVPQGYVEGVRAAGGLPLLVPPLPEVVDDPAAVLDVVDGLVLVGGEDLDPSSYGADPHPETDPPNVRRDAAELALLQGALDRDMPVLGICRGAQLINVAYGGDLVQHVADVLDPTPHRPSLGEFGRHLVSVTGGRLRELVGPEVPDVSSHHHQALGRIGEGLVPTAVAPDGLVEALEDPERDFCIAVLWHPEEDPHGSGAPIFGALVEHARRRAARRS